MNLVAPFFLAGLALLIPILITFLVRQNRRTLRVPSTMVWRLGAKSIAQSRRIKNLRRLIALALCLLGVGALVFAAARPTGSRTETTIYIVDVSSSMDGSPLSDAKSWLVRDVAGMGNEARVAIILASSEPRVLLPPSPPGPAVDQAIASLQSDKEIAAMEEAITLARGLAGDVSDQPPSKRPRLVILSDEAIADSDPAPAVEADAGVVFVRKTVVSLLKPEMRVFARKSKGAVDDNLGITSLYTRTPPDARDDEEREATVVIATSSNAPRRARLVVSLAGKTLADRVIDVAANGEITERVGIRGGGKLVAKVSPADKKRDALGIDDEAALEEVTRHAPRVGLVHAQGPDEGSAAYFVEKALRAAGVTELEHFDPSTISLNQGKTNAVEVAVVLKEGGRPTDVPSLLIGSVVPDGLAARAVTQKEAKLRSIANEDPLMRGVALDEITTLRAHVATSLPRDSRSLVDLDSGSALVAGGSGKHAWVWLGIDPEASDLVLRVAFPVLISNVLTHLSGASQIISAKTVPRSETMMMATNTPAEAAPAALPAVREPRWKIPAAPAMFLAAIGALLLVLEIWVSFKRKRGGGAAAS
jgi:hypothetical protein